MTDEDRKILKKRSASATARRRNARRKAPLVTADRWRLERPNGHRQREMNAIMAECSRSI